MQAEILCSRDRSAHLSKNWRGTNSEFGVTQAKTRRLERAIRSPPLFTHD